MSLSEYYLPIGLALLAILVLPTAIKFVTRSVKGIVIALLLTAFLGSAAFASFKQAAEDRVDQEIEKQAAANKHWNTVKTTKAEAKELRAKVRAGETKIYKVAGVNQQCAAKLASGSSPTGKAKAYLLYCEDGKTYKLPK